MQTNAYSYNHALHNIAETQQIESDEAAAIINGTGKVSLHLHCIEADIADARVREQGKYPYNSDVARVLLNILKIPETTETLDRAETIVYGSSHYRDAQDAIKLYEDMEASGYISIHDITHDMDNKKALLSGKMTLDWMTSKKENEPVVLVNHGKVYGYRKPRMRTRYYTPQLDANLFVKLQ
jgi:hypothetical protein